MDELSFTRKLKYGVSNKDILNWPEWEVDSEWNPDTTQGKLNTRDAKEKSATQDTYHQLSKMPLAEHHKNWLTENGTNPNNTALEDILVNLENTKMNVTQVMDNPNKQGVNNPPAVSDKASYGTGPAPANIHHYSQNLNTAVKQHYSLHKNGSVTDFMNSLKPNERKALKKYHFVDADTLSPDVRKDIAWHLKLDNLDNTVLLYNKKDEKDLSNPNNPARYKAVKVIQKFPEKVETLDSFAYEVIPGLHKNIEQKSSNLFQLDGISYEFNKTEGGIAVLVGAGANESQKFVFNEANPEEYDAAITGIAQYHAALIGVEGAGRKGYKIRPQQPGVNGTTGAVNGTGFKPPEKERILKKVNTNFAIEYANNTPATTGLGAPGTPLGKIRHQ